MAKKTPESSGECRLCGETFKSSGMTSHLKSCVKKNRESNDQEEVGLYHMVARGGGGLFWLHFEVVGEAPLEVVDDFLRSIWVECCGHLSAFTINNQRYSPQPMDSMMARNPEKPTDVPICEVLSNNDEFHYEYDYGSTTHLEMRVVDVREGPRPERAVRVLARNQMPEFECAECGATATQICPTCWEDNLFCDECAPEHPCYDDYGGLLPLVNSPRAGVCGYTGRFGDQEW
ncbi:MAG: IS1096 element passenger TnpR family protein [Candidatus Brocadiia bacterium]